MRTGVQVYKCFVMVYVFDASMPATSMQRGAG